MMILAKSNYSELIALAVFAVVAIISAVAKHAEKKNQEKQQLEAEEQRRQRETSGKALPPTTTRLLQQTQQTQQQAQRRLQKEQLAAARAAQAQPEAQPQAQASPRQPVRRYPPMPTTPQRQPAPAAPKPTAARRYSPVQPQPVQPQPIAQPIEAKKKPAPHRTVEQEITRLQSRLAKLESMRSKRLSTALPSETSTAAIEARLVSVRTPLREEAYQETTAMKFRPVVGINLASHDAARRAIIMHEIFSPPKAMRHQPEAWEM